MRILILTKRQYTNKDLLDDRFGRLREIPLALAKRGHDVMGVCLSYSPREEGWSQDGAVRWNSINATGLKLRGLQRFIREAHLLASSVDVIWACSDSFYGVIGFFLGKKTGIPLVFDLYDNFEYFLAARLPVLKQLYRYAVRNCAAVTCVSRPLAGLIETYGRSAGVFVMENAVELSLFVPLDRNDCRAKFGLPIHGRIIGTAGALDRNRGIERLFEAFSLLKAKHPDLRLALAGPRTKSMEIPRDPQVHDMGVLSLDEVPNFLNALDVAVVCNLDSCFGRYCFPQKAREIMACDVPLVAARVGSMKEVLKEHPEWLYDPNDSEDLARVLERRLEDRSTSYEPIMSWEESALILESILTAVVRQTANDPLKG